MLLRVKSTGVIEELPEKGLVKYGKPIGVVAAITPSTNPSATPVNKAMMALKGGNAVIIAPSPAGYAATAATVDGMRAELEKIGAPQDLVQIIPSPVDRQRTKALMAAADLIVCTGSQNNVRQSYSSGTPAIGVGAGKRARDHRRNRGSERRRRKDHRLQDFRQRHQLLVGKQRDNRRRNLRGRHPGADISWGLLDLAWRGASRGREGYGWMAS